MSASAACSRGKPRPAHERAKLRLARYLESVSLECEEVLVEFDCPIEYVYLLETAVTSTAVRTPDGDTVGVGLMGSEGFVGLSHVCDVGRSNGSVVVQAPGLASRMRAADFRRHVKAYAGPCLDLLLRYANFFQVMVQQHAACTAACNLESRMCRRILLTHDRAGGDNFPLTQDYLSLMLGVRRPPVTETAHRLKDEGLIGYTRQVQSPRPQGARRALLRLLPAHQGAGRAHLPNLTAAPTL